MIVILTGTNLSIFFTLMISAFGMCRDENLQISLAFYEADHVEVFVSMVTREYTFSIETKPWH